jgi:hypothetical protein
MLPPDVVWSPASTFGNILNRCGLTNPQKKRNAPRHAQSRSRWSRVRGSCGAWTSRGNFSTGDGEHDPFTITDAYSRYLIRCQIVSHMGLSQVRAICDAAMREYGVPARIRTDNGAPFRVYWAIKTFQAVGTFYLTNKWTASDPHIKEHHWDDKWR